MMKVYEVEYRVVITFAAEDMQKATLHGAAVIKDNAYVMWVKAVHEKTVEAALEIFGDFRLSTAGKLTVRDVIAVRNRDSVD
jgi:hypothetical protein